jgi:hypothetical protein
MIERRAVGLAGIVNGSPAIAAMRSAVATSAKNVEEGVSLPMTTRSWLPLSLKHSPTAMAILCTLVGTVFAVRRTPSVANGFRTIASPTKDGFLLILPLSSVSKTLKQCRLG